MSDSRKSAGAIFDAVLELPHEERPAFLGQVCAGDAGLRERVKALIEAHEAAGGFMGSPAQLPISKTESLALKDQSGERIGRYKLLQQIGEGGCGVVYMAEQEEPVRRRVALKVIKLGMDTRRVIARFEAERQALALMEHPNIAKVLDGGATDLGRPYFVMELVRGVRITDYCDANQFSTEKRLMLFAKVCQAIQHAHQKGIVHRDIKPSNILVADHDGVPVPKVIDFGIAKATTDQPLTDKTLFTAFEQFIGTPAYMSPEQANLSGLDVDTRTDIYSLGVLLYELLTGKTPFDGKDLLQAGLEEMRRTIREREPVRPSTRLSGMQSDDLTTTANHRHTNAPRLIHLLRGDLDWIVMKCLEKDRARRYDTANGLAMDIQYHLNNEPVTARPPSKSYRLQKLVQRNRLVFAATGSIAITILLALIFLLFSNAHTIRERNQKDAALGEKAAALVAAKTSEQQAKQQLFASLRNQAQARRYSRKMGQRLESLAALEEAARIRVDASLRDDAIATFALPDVRRGPSWQVSATNCVAMTCDSMGKRYAMLDRAGVLAVHRIEDNQELRRFEIERGCSNCFTKLAFSPDGRFLVKVGDDQQPLLWSLENGETVLQEAPIGASAPTFSADGRYLALALGDEVCRFDLATGRLMNRWKTRGHIHELQFHPSDPRIAVSYKEGPWVSVYDATDGGELAQLEVGEGWRMVVSWHPDGRRVAVGSTSSGIQIWDVEAQRCVVRLQSHAREVDFLTYHPSGNWLASWTWDGVMDLWEPAKGRLAMQIPLTAELQFSRDGRWLGFFWPSEERAQLLELVLPQDYSTLQDDSREGRETYNSCSISPDDRLLAVAMDNGVHVWDLPGRRKVAVLPSGENESVLFEADGRALWTCATNLGLQRWPCYPSGANNTEPRIGPPQLLALPFAPRRVVSDQATRILAVISIDAGRAMVVDLTNQAPRNITFDHPAADSIALSPDGKWLATSGWRTDRCRLWNAQSGELVKDWVVGAETTVGFSPDSRELVVARGGEFYFLSIATLGTSRRLKREIGLFPGGVAFSPDGKLMAMEIAPAVIHLKEVSTGRTIAQLEDPFGDRSSMISFTHEGSRLVVLSSYASAIHIWNLRGIRSRLKGMGLDWDWPEFTGRPKD